jgi:hypothetical protein
VDLREAAAEPRGRRGLVSRPPGARHAPAGGAARSAAGVGPRRWRVSGPSVVEHGSYSRNYGPHFPLRVYYSPEIVAWLCDGRQGAIPDGAMIVKAMSVAWKALDVRTAADGCMDLASDPAAPIQPNLWAPMIKTSRASYDGWY